MACRMDQLALSVRALAPGARRARARLSDRESMLTRHILGIPEEVVPLTRGAREADLRRVALGVRECERRLCHVAEGGARCHVAEVHGLWRSPGPHALRTQHTPR